MFYNENLSFVFVSQEKLLWVSLLALWQLVLTNFLRDKGGGEEVLQDEEGEEMEGKDEGEDETNGKEEDGEEEEREGS